MAEAIDFDRAPLAAALDLASKVRPWRRDERQPGLVRFDIADGLARLTSTTFEHAIVVTAPCGAGKATLHVPLDPLRAALSKTKADSVILTPTETGAILAYGRFRVRLEASDPIVAPEGAAVASGNHLIDAPTLRAGLAAVTDATIEDAAQPSLAGVFIGAADGAIAFAAMDSNRVHAQRLVGPAAELRAILPRALVRLLLDVLPEQGEVVTAIDDRRARFEAGNVVVTSVLIQGQFPPYRQLLDLPQDRTLSARADQLLADLETVAVVANPKHVDVRLDLGQACRASAFRAASTGFESGDVDLQVSFSGAPLAIGFQMKLVRDALRQFGERPVEWRMRGPTDPTIITSPAAPGLEILVSPFMLERQRHLEAA